MKRNFYVHAIERNAAEIVESNNTSEILNLVSNISNYSDWGDEKQLYYTFFTLFDEYDDYPFSGYSSRSQIIAEMKSEAENLLRRFRSASISEKKKIVSDGFSAPRYIPDQTGNR